MKLRHLLFTIVLMTAGYTASAQQEAAESEKGLKKEAIKEFADKHLRLSGYLQGGFSWDEQGDPTTTFYLRRARVSLSGDFAKEKFDYRLQVDFAGGPKICDLYLRYKPLNGINVQLGQFKLPFSLENELYGPTKFEFIEYSYLTTYLVRNDGMYDGIKATGRDIGLQLYGGFIKRDGYNIINYNVGVFNGSGINSKDNNSSKDFIARLIIKPIKGLSLSGSYMYGETNYDGNRYMKSPRWAVGAIYDVRHWIARAEFASAKFDERKIDAFYALAGYHFEKPWSVVARYEFLNDDTITIPNQERITLGAVYKPFKFLRLQLNMSYTMYEDLKLPEVSNPSSLGANLMVSMIF
ncbi:MAG: porin [Alistipes sp.]|nr:porin [Alistipes sp.]